MSQHPTSVTRASQLLLVLVVAGLVVSVLVVVFRGALDDAWSAGHPVDSAIKPLSFVPVVVVLYVVFAGLTLSLLPFLRSAHNWARHTLASVVLFIAVSTLAGVRTGPPTLFLVLSVAAFALYALILFYLWHRDTTRFVRGSATRVGSDA